MMNRSELSLRVMSDADCVFSDKLLKEAHLHVMNGDQEFAIRPVILLEMWLKYLQSLGYARHTRMAYQRDVSDFLCYFQQQKIALIDIERADLRHYLQYCQQQLHWSSSTVQRHLSSIRQFMKWLKEQGILDSTLSLKLKRAARVLPGWLSMTDIQQFLDVPEPTQLTEYQRVLWQRDTAMFELMYASGLRVSELLSLTTSMIDWSQNQLRVQGKGQKVRLVPFHQKAKTALLEWLTQREQLDLPLWIQQSEIIFVSKQTAPMSIRQVQYRIKQRAKVAGLQADVYPHLLRHCFATHLLHNDGELRTIQELLGHKHLSTTQVYTHLNLKMIQEKYQMTHPRAKR